MGLQTEQNSCIGTYQKLYKITLLQKEGHPIKPGSTGENLTIKGLDWTKMKEGLILTIGDIKLEITGPAAPCKTIAKSFKEGKFIRISEKIHPQSSRWYAKVLKEGVVYKNDSVALLQIFSTTFTGQ